MNSAIKWHGGKSYLAERICHLIQPHTTYCEPYFGGGWVLFRKFPNNSSEIINDLNGELMNFWTQLRDNFAELHRRVLLTPFHETVFTDSLICKTDSLIERAVKFYVRNRMSRQGLSKDFVTPTQRQRSGINEHVSAYLSSVEELPSICERLQKVLIYNREAIDIIEMVDNKSTFFYCDPPYMLDTRQTKDAYTHEMSDTQHVMLLHKLGHIQGKFILSGYNNNLYADAKSKYGWKMLTFDMPNHSSSSKIKERKQETIWYNI